MVVVKVDAVGDGNPGAEVHGFDLSRAPEADADWMKQQLAQHGVLVFRKQTMSPDDFIRLATLFGETSH